MVKIVFDYAYKMEYLKNGPIHGKIGAYEKRGQRLVMENLIFSLNATVPVFLLMVLGMVLRRIGWVDEEFALKMNSFVFLVPLPVMVFKDLAEVDMNEMWDGGFVLFCFVVTLLCIGISALFSLLWKDGALRGEFIQASYRSSAAILGMALVENMYGSAEMVPLMMIGSVPLYNIMAVVVLSLTRPGEQGLGRETMKKALKDIVTNPIIIAIVLGLLWSLLRIPMPAIMEKTVDNLSATATPLGLIAMGATFDLKKALEQKAPAITATVLKLVGFCALFLPVAALFGFSGQEMAAILIMLGSATTVSCYVMAQNMGHDGVMTSSTVMLTTILSAFTLTGWLFVLRTLNLL